MEFPGAEDIQRALILLDATLEARGAAPVELVVIGGAAMNVLGLCARPTKDVDVLATCESADAAGDVVLIKCKPLPEPVAAAAVAVAQALGLDGEWLNPGPADLLDFGLPHGFAGRLLARPYGRHLTIHLPSREDLICLKAYAAADAGVGRHTQDLATLEPTCQELLTAARWARTQDPSEGFRPALCGLLRFFGCDDAAEVLHDDH